MAVATPIQAFITAPLAQTGAGQSTFMTVVLSIPTVWEAVVPFNARQPTTVTAGPEIRVYRSWDGGTNYETIPTTAFAILRNTNDVSTMTLRLDTGQYALQICTGGGMAANVTVQIQTVAVVTAIQNV